MNVTINKRRKTMLKKWQQTQRIKLAVLFIISIVSLGIMAESIAANPKEGSIDGIWKTEGYNLIVEIQNGEFTIYEITNISCLQVPSWFDEQSMNFNATLLDNGKLAMSHDLETFYYEASRLSELPEVCQHGITQKTSDPETNFEVFWHTANENYAFFDLRGVDWQTKYAEYRDMVTTSTSDEELFGMMAAMLEPLQDKHVTLLGGEELEWDTNTQNLPEWLDLEAAGEYLEAHAELWSAMNELAPEEFAQKYAEAVKQSALLLEEIALRDIMPVIKQQYLKNEMTRTGDGSILYGKLTNTVGYIFLPEVRMNVFDLEGDIDGKGLALMERALDQIVQDFQGIETIILDLRFNLGGADMYGLAMASRFADQKRPVISREARNGTEFGSPRTFYLEPEGKKQFSAGQVICLTSGLTISAGESLTMMLRALPHVTVLGEATQGVLSDMQIRRLPNGWEMTLSNERYYDYEGHCYEVTGVPPDIELPLDIEGFQAGRDNMLDAALELAQQVSPILTPTVENPIPEPSTFLLLATGLGGFLVCERRRRNLRK
jgi:carboxyl-terminal processing protease